MWKELQNVLRTYDSRGRGTEYKYSAHKTRWTEYKLDRALKIENKPLWENYKYEKEQMLTADLPTLAACGKRMPSGMHVPRNLPAFPEHTALDERVNESWLVHGTASDEAAEGILRNNFAMSNARGELFGKGLHFAEDAGKSISYASDWIFVVRCLVGYFEPNSSTGRLQTGVRPLIQGTEEAVNERPKRNKDGDNGGTVDGKGVRS